MGESQAYPPARPFEKLFNGKPRFREEALEAVKQLKLRKHYDAEFDLRVRQILERAIRKQREQKEELPPGFVRLHRQAAAHLDRVMALYRFGVPPFIVQTRWYLWLAGEMQKPASRPGRKPMPHYQVALSDFQQIKIPRRLAVPMLRGCGIMVPGPPPKG